MVFGTIGEEHERKWCEAERGDREDRDEVGVRGGAGEGLTSLRASDNGTNPAPPISFPASMCRASRA